MNNNKNKGFTLIELMTSVAIISILLALASPSFSGFVKNNKITTSAKNFYSDLNYAKSEALKGRANVVMKASSSDYKDGWLIFIDINENNVYDSGDVILRQQDALPVNQVITMDGQDYLSFNSYGEINSDTKLSFKFCDDRADATGKNISINPIGLIKVVDSTC